MILKEIMKKNKDLVMLLSDALMERETLTKEQIESLVLNGKIEENDEISSNDDEPTILKLRELAKAKGIKGYTKMNKEELKEALDKEENL